MVLITKEEKDAILKQYPNTHIVRTVKQKSKRHKYYCTETWKAMRLLATLRGEEPKTGASQKNKRRGDRVRT